MKFRTLMLTMVLLTSIFISTFPVSAQEPQPVTPETAPLPPLESNSESSDSVISEDNGLELAAAGLDLAGLPPLKAVLIVGPIDGPTGAVTKQEIANMELAAARLSANGVQVLKFYTPNDNWANIVAASNGAHFLMYRGHGLNWNPNDWVTPTVGGISLTEKMYSSADIKRDFRLAPNAIIMLYGCFTTGSSTTDPSPINLEEARRRTSEYSQPFFELGAAGYYANWYGNAFAKFVDNLFAGQTLGDAFKNYSDFEAAKWTATTHSSFSNVPMWLSWDNWPQPYPIPSPQFNHAFVGQSSKTLLDLFKPTVQLSVPALAYIAKPSAKPRTYKVSVQASGGANISWTASPASGTSVPSWVTYTPTTGSTGTDLNITINPPSGVGKYQASLDIKTADGSSKQTLTITMIATNNPRYIYLPGVIK
jgi:hypothetical protein